jgi:hypothetical protein
MPNLQTTGGPPKGVGINISIQLKLKNATKLMKIGVKRRLSYLENYTNNVDQAGVISVLNYPEGILNFI